MLRVTSFIIGLCVWSSISDVHAASFCVVPLKNGQPKLDIEKEQPYRMAIAPRTFGGATGLFVKAFNRHEIFEITGNEFSKVESEFPHFWGSAYSNYTHRLQQGGAVGFGAKPKKIYYLPPKGRRFQVVEGTQDYLKAAFDKVSGKPFIWMKGAAKIFTLQEGKLTETAMPVIPGLGMGHPRYISELSGFLSTADNHFWFLKDGSEAWHGNRLKVFTLNFATILKNNGHSR